MEEVKEIEKVVKVKSKPGYLQGKKEGTRLTVRAKLFRPLTAISKQNNKKGRYVIGELQ